MSAWRKKAAYPGLKIYQFQYRPDEHFPKHSDQHHRISIILEGELKAALRSLQTLQFAQSGLNPEV